MQITVYKNFSKRINSTKQPSTGTNVNVQLKDNCSIEAPVFILDGVDPSINYIKAFSNYYYVSDKTVLDGHRMQLTCAIDLLASGKGDILAGTAMVKRSSSLFNGAMRDDMVSVSATATKSFVGASAEPFSNVGCFVINVASSGSRMGSTRAYILDYDNMAAFSKWLCGDSTDPNWSSIETWAMASFGNIFGALMGCKWLPISYSSLKTEFSITEVAIHIGKWDVPTASGLAIINGLYTDVASIDISDVFNPNDFRKMPPYSAYEIFLPFYGVLNLDAAKLTSVFSVALTLDPRTGDLYYEGFAGESILFTITINCGVDIPVAQVTMFRENNIQTLQAGITSMLSSTGVGGLTAAINGAKSIISATTDPAVNIRGNIGGMAMAEDNSIYVAAIQFDTTEPTDLEATYGRPLEVCMSLANLTGYVQTFKASISTKFTPNETNSINAMLDSGIYIE